MPQTKSSTSTNDPTLLPSEQRFVIFTCRDIRTDFRWPLAEALRTKHETWYIWLRRRPRVLRPAADATFKEVSFLSLIFLLLRLTRKRGENFYLNSTNTSFPVTVVLLRLLCGRGLWCLDMHDDLLYDFKGLRRVQAAMAVKLQAYTAHIVIRAAESLRELFPTSLPFGNASQIGLIVRTTDNFKSVLVLASLDARFDFDFLTAVAKSCHGRTFEIYGQVSRNDDCIRANLVTLCEASRNVVYRGAYDLDGLESILSRYSVSLAPYCIDSRLTRYLDPLRFYHCLNSGMELITTAIPQAERLRPALHIVHTAPDVEHILKQMETDIDSRRNTPQNYRQQTWTQRSERLVELGARYSIAQRSS